MDPLVVADLDFSEIEAGKLEPEAIGFDLEECVWSVVRSVAPAARAEGLALCLRLATACPRGAWATPSGWARSWPTWPPTR